MNRKVFVYLSFSLKNTNITHFFGTFDNYYLLLFVEINGLDSILLILSKEE